MKSHLVYSFELQEGDRIFEDNHLTKVLAVVRNKKYIVIHLTDGQILRVDRNKTFDKVTEI